MNSPPWTDFSQIAPKLWMGAYPRLGYYAGPPAPEKLCLEIIAGKGIQNWVAVASGFPRCDFEMHDVDDRNSAFQETLQFAEQASAHVFQILSRGESVLVTCNMGINRSGLVCALALMLEGLTAKKAIDAVRLGRPPIALHNRFFVDHLLSLAPRSQTR